MNDILMNLISHLQASGPDARGYWRARCPFHEDTRPSFYFDDTWGRCWACWPEGGPLRVVAARLGLLTDALDGREDGRLDAGSAGQGRKQEPGTGEQSPPSGGFVSPEMARAFIEEAGISWDEAQKLGVAWDRERRAIAFSWPSTRARKMRLAREGGQKWAWDAPDGARKPSLWPEPSPETLSGSTAVVLTEGERDALALRALGLPAFSVTYGAGTPPRQEDVAKLLALGVRRFVLAYDADSPGGDGEGKTRAAILATARRWHLRVEVENLPLPLEAVAEGCKDWVDAVRVLGAEELRAVARASSSLIGNDGDDGDGGPVPLAQYVAAAGPGWVVPGLVPQGFATNLYGDSGQGKSWLALLLALCVAGGRPFLTIPISQGPVLYLDWELSPEVQGERLGRLLRGLGLEAAPDGLLYRRMDAPLPDAFDQVREWVGRHRPVLVVVDSYQAAAGDDPLRPQVVSSFYQRLRELGTAVLVVDHQARAGDAEYANRYEFGSSYKRHLARSSLQLEAAGREAGRLGLVLRHQKSSFGTRHQDMHLVLEFREDGAVVVRGATEAERRQQTLFGAGGAVLEALERLGQATAEDLAEATDLDIGTARNVLTHLRRNGLVQVVGRGGPSGRANLYRLAPRRASSPSFTNSGDDDDDGGGPGGAVVIPLRRREGDFETEGGGDDGEGVGAGGSPSPSPSSPSSTHSDEFTNIGNDSGAPSRATKPPPGHLVQAAIAMLDSLGVPYEIVRCRMCGGDRWWTNLAGEKICSRCHPPPGARGGGGP